MYLHCCTVSDNIMCALTLKYTIYPSVAALVSLQLHHASIELQLRHRFLVLPEHVLGRVPVLSEKIMLFRLRLRVH